MNKIVIIGNLTKDPELRTTQTGVFVCSFGIAVNRRRKVEGQPDVDFFNVTAWRQLGENCAKYLSKGKKACVVGSVQIRTYAAKDGGKGVSVDVQADEVEFLTPAQQGGYQTSDAGQQASNVPPAGGYMEFTQVDEGDLPF